MGPAERGPTQPGDAGCADVTDQPGTQELDDHQHPAALISSAVIWKAFSTSSSSITVMRGASYGGLSTAASLSFFRSVIAFMYQASSRLSVPLSTLTISPSASISCREDSTSDIACGSSTPLKLTPRRCAISSELAGCFSSDQMKDDVRLRTQNLLLAEWKRITSSCSGANSIPGLC